MTRPRRAPGGADTALLWLACAIAVCAGSYLAFGLLGGAIDLTHQVSGRVAEMMLADDRLLAGRPQLERDREAVERKLRDLDLQADKPTLVARFIGSVTAAAATQRVNLDGVEERAAVAPPAASLAELRAQRADNPTFETIPFDVTLSGTYRGLLAAIRALAQAPIAMRIEIAAIERAPAATGLPLTAHLHVLLQRLADATTGPAPGPLLPEDNAIHARSL